MAKLVHASRDRVLDFARGLASALYDKSLEERGQKIIYYHDADVVSRLIRGFQSVRSRVSPISQKELLVGSLLSAGYLGTASLLRPHALELDSGIRMWAVRVGSHGLRGFKEEAQTFLLERGVAADIDLLLAIIKSSGSKEERIDRFWSALKEVAVEVFVSLELVSGPWEYRIRRLMGRTEGDVLSLSDLGRLQMRRLVSTPKFIEFRSLISASGDVKRQPLNDLRDALAFTMLHRMVESHNNTKSGPVVRFHTETPTLRQVWAKHESIRNSLTYQFDDSQDELAGSLAARTVWRDTTYFLIRAAFEELRFPGVQPRKVQASLLEELKKVSRALRDVPRESEQEVAAKVNDLTLGGKPLSDVLRELEASSFVHGVVSKYEPTASVKAMVEHLDEVWHFAQEGAATSRLRKKIQSEVKFLAANLKKEVEVMRLWFSRYREIYSRVSALPKGLSDCDTPDPMRDLGLVRWGSDLSKEAEDRIRLLWEIIFSGDEAQLSSASGELASAIEDSEDIDECVVTCAILWFLGLYGRVVETVDSFTELRWSQCPFSLMVLRFAAFLRGKGDVSHEERKAIVGLLERKLTSLQGEQRGRALLGFGYVLFYCWLLDNRRHLFDLKWEGADDWHIRSFQAGTEALKLLREGSLAKAFAVNHCVYVGSICEIFSEETQGLTWQLTSEESIPEHWNYRFADTFAYRAFLSAIRLRVKAGPKLDEALRKEICDKLAAAVEWIEKAFPSFGDSEISEHRSQIRHLQIQEHCAI